jgi:hypothetical protein
MSTRKRKDEGDTPFGAWMRDHDELDSKVVGFDAENLDYIFFLYKQGYLRLIEEKWGYNNFPTFAQHDTHGLVSQMCQFACSHPDFEAKRARTGKIVYGGYHLLQFENTNPEDGGVRLNGMPITKEQLIQFIQNIWKPIIQYETMKNCQSILIKIGKCKTKQELNTIRDKIENNNKNKAELKCEWCTDTWCSGCFSDFNETDLILLRTVLEEQERIIK